MYACFQHKNEVKNVSKTKNEPTVALENPLYPYETPCSNHNYDYFITAIKLEQHNYRGSLAP